MLSVDFVFFVNHHSSVMSFAPMQH